MRNADRMQGAPGLDLVLHAAQRGEIRNDGRRLQLAALRGHYRYLLLCRQQYVDGAQPGDAASGCKPGQGIVGETRHPMQRTDITRETGEAERRRRQDFNVVTERAQTGRDLTDV